MSLLTRVAAAMQEIAPLSLADRSWDNVGTLVESPVPNAKNKVLLTIDLTAEVLQECVEKHIEVIVSYHPPIFRPMKRLTMQDAKQELILRVVQAGMSIYAPHTSLDAAEGGINDWLAYLVDGSGDAVVSPILPTASYAPGSPDKTDATGMGRLVQMRAPVAFKTLVASLKEGLCLPTVRVAVPDGWTAEKKVQRVALCAGSGSGVFKDLKKPADVLLSGEMGHHDVLAAKAAGQAVILCEHTNTERGFLEAVLKKKLGDRLPGVDVLVAESDHDPLTVW